MNRTAALVRPRAAVAGVRAALTAARAGDWSGSGLPAARALCAAAVLFAVVCSVLTMLVAVRFPSSETGLLPLEGAVSMTAGALLFAVLGTAIVCRGRGPRIGWLMVGTAVVLAVDMLAAALGSGYQVGHPVPFGQWAAWLDDFVWVFLLLGAWLVLILFPDGRATTRPARVAVVTGCTLAGLIVLLFPFQPGRLYDYPEIESPLAPVPWLSRVSVVMHEVLGPAIPAMFLFAAACVGWRYRTSGTEVRAQIRWLGWFATLLAFGIIGQNTLPQPWATVSQVLTGLGFPLLPIVVTVAVLRFRLYDIDRLVSRTVTYALLTGLLVGVYVAVVTVVSALAHDSVGSIGVALATLAAVSLVRPLRRRLQSLVDRRFDRARFDARRAVQSYAEGLRADDRDPGSDLLQTLDQVVGPTRAWLWTPPPREPST